MRLATVPISSAALGALEQRSQLVVALGEVGARSRPAGGSASCAFTAASRPRAVRCTASLTGRRRPSRRESSRPTPRSRATGSGTATGTRPARALSCVTRSAYSSDRPCSAYSRRGCRMSRSVGVDAGHPRGHLVAEVGVDLPLDRALGDALDDRRGVRDAHLLRALVASSAADPAGVHAGRPRSGFAASSSRKRLPWWSWLHREERVRARARAGTCPPRPCRRPRCRWSRRA